MGIQKKHAPGCTCCFCDCALFTENFLTLDLGVWTVESGTWAANAGTYVYSLDANAILLLTDSGDWSYNWSIKVKAITGGVFQYKVFWSWQSSSDHWYLSLDATVTPNKTKVVQVVSGVENVLINKDYTTTLNGVAICFENGFLTIQQYVGVGPTFIDQEWLQLEVSPAQGKIGIGTIYSRASVTAATQFDTVIYDRNPCYTQVCLQCWNGLCCGGYAMPDTITITLSGLSSPYDVWNGTYVLSAFNVSAGSCQWQTTALTNLSGGAPLEKYLRVSRGQTAPEISISLRYQKPDTTVITYVGSTTIDSGFSWTTSPCNDSWGTLPASLERSVNGVFEAVDGSVTSMDGNF